MTKSGNLENNEIERFNRYLSISRRNSLFFGSHKGAERGAILYTIALSCKMQKIDLFEYLSDVINRTAEWQPNTPIKKGSSEKWSDIISLNKKKTAEKFVFLNNDKQILQI